MSDSVDIGQLMGDSGVKFGTSGARGLVVEMTDRVCVAYTLAFLIYLREEKKLQTETPVAIAGDLRPSTHRIATAVAFAARHLGHPVEFSGWIPSPAVALRGLEQKMPAIMVTGSHIPDDRNGIKFNTSEGEITKEDERGMVARSVSLPDAFDEHGMFLEGLPLLEAGVLGDINPKALVAYKNRYLESFPAACLSGVRLGVYGHSAVGRDFLVELYASLGADVVPLGFSETFVPVDTEAIRPEDVELARSWAAEHSLDSIVSTDGDSDRPLISDEEGRWIRGDVTGIVTASYLGATAVATPVSCNTAVEKSRAFDSVVRTRIGSPFVIAGMAKASRAGAKRVVGYEANGGFLSWSDLSVPGGKTLSALPTRDAVVVHLAVLLSAQAKKCAVSEVFAELPERYTVSDRDQSFSQNRSKKLFDELEDMSVAEVGEAFALGPLKGVDMTDGMRFTFASDEIVHLRPSGNAPELRCYAEAESDARAVALVALGLEVARRLCP